MPTSSLFVRPTQTCTGPIEVSVTGGPLATARDRDIPHTVAIASVERRIRATNRSDRRRPELVPWWRGPTPRIEPPEQTVLWFGLKTLQPDDYGVRSAHETPEH